MSPGRGPAIAGVGLMGLLALCSVWAFQSLTRQLAALPICNAVAEERWDQAIALSEDQSFEGPEGRDAAECRCWALLASDREADCAELLDELLDRPEARGWLPHPVQARVAIRGRRDHGDAAAAATLARRATEIYPADRDLLQLEIMTRGVIEGEDVVLEDLEARVKPGAPESPALRLVLSHAHHRRGAFTRALAVLGEEFPQDDATAAAWFEARARALASLGRREAVVATYRAWYDAGANPYELRGRYALRLSQAGLADPTHSWIELLRGALATEDRIEDPEIREALYLRLIGHLLADDEADEALRVYDRARSRFELRGLTRDQLVRNAALPNGNGATEGGILAFRVPEELSGGTLFVSPEADQPPDRAYEATPVQNAGPLHVTRRSSILPTRWVLRDRSGRTRASGAVWPVPGQTVDVEVEAGPPVEVEPYPYRPNIRPGDGRRRVFVILPDCEDWRLLQYLRTRGELPVQDYLLETGFSGVLESTPPLTAAAMESLVWPSRGRHTSFVGLAHRLGVEIAGLASVGENPLGFLQALLPEGPNLFETVGSGDLVAANLLFAHGNIDAGRHAEILGPNGRRRSSRSGSALRPLTQEERERFPGLLRHPKFVPLIETIAAELDTAVEIAREGEVDLLLVRIEALDILTHAHFHELVRPGQDDGDAALLWVYRYIDARLASVLEALDRDDLLIVMSDHGIRTPMEHDKDAVFVVVGEGVPRGRADGTPHLRGVPRLITDLLGIETGWPETGIAAWAAGG